MSVVFTGNYALSLIFIDSMTPAIYLATLTTTPTTNNTTGDNLLPVTTMLAINLLQPNSL
jgi:hypothetical protein